MADISLLPEEMRKKGDSPRKASGTGEDLAFHIPQTDIGGGLGSGETLVSDKKKLGFFTWLFGTKQKKLTVVATVPTPTPADVSPSQQKKSFSSIGSMMRAEQASRTVSVPTTQPAVPHSPSIPPASATPAPQPAPSARIVPPAATVPQPARNERGTTQPRNVAPAPAPTVSAVHAVAGPSAPGLRVSLIPTMQQEGAGFASRQHKKALALGVGLLVMVCVGTALALRYVAGQKAEAEKQTAAAARAEQSLLAMHQSLESARLFAKQVRTLRILLGGHIAWSHFFVLLEKNTHQDIAFVQLATDGMDTVLLQADARSYRSIAEQVQHLSQVSGIREVGVSGITTELGPTGALKGVHVLLTIRFDPRIIAAENDTARGL